MNGLEEEVTNGEQLSFPWVSIAAAHDGAVDADGFQHDPALA